MERILTILWLLLIPSQLGKHFWLSESSVLGIRIDFLSIILYLTDLVWFLWAISQLRTSGYKLRIKNLLNLRNLILVLVILANIFLATAKWVALYRWLRIGQWYLTWLMVKKNKEKIMGYLRWVIPVWIVVESLLGAAQVINGGSLNGIWWLLGERRFVYGGIGIAQMNWFGENLIRAYGTFSHPNSLAGFLLLSWWYWRDQLRVKNKEQIITKIIYWMVNWCALLGIILAGSRTVWMGGIILLAVNLWQGKNREIRKTVGNILLVTGVVVLILGLVNINYKISDFVGGWDKEGIEKREKLAMGAVAMIKSNPLFGVGAGNFVVRLPEFKEGNFYWWQPVHNILLLALSEVGLLGIIILIFNFKFIFFKLKEKKYWWLWIIVGITGMMDHYWLSLPQNTWLLAIILGVI